MSYKSNVPTEREEERVAEVSHVHRSIPAGQQQQRWTTRQRVAKAVTFPRATAEVAMSRTKLSPSVPGAATLRGLVPKVHWKEPDHHR